MESIEIYPKIIVRVPKFSYIEQMKDKWPLLKDAIREASPDLFCIIETMSFDDFAIAPIKIRQTVYKYFNRMRFRCTPFGTMAALGVAQLKNGGPSYIKIAGEPVVHRFDNWPERPAYQPSLQPVIYSGARVYSNTTYYTLADQIRFLQKTNDNFQIAAIDKDPFILEILDYCFPPKHYSQLVDSFNIEETMLQQCLLDLLNIGLLFTEHYPNIIGEDYFLRLRFKTETDTHYIISELQFAEDTINRNCFRFLPEALQLLRRVTDAVDPVDLSNFRERFYKKFELAEIPLMLALDPEVGVGYGNLEVSAEDSAPQMLLKKDHNSNDGNSRLKSQLYRAIASRYGSRSPIELADLVGETVGEENILPNTFIVLGTLIDDDFYLEMAGGATANALLGRFAHAVEEIESFSREIASQEEASNPDILFFDVGYTKEEQVDNINRRPSIYPLQLNILNYDTSLAPLAVSDIVISIRKGEVVLRSKRLNKRLVPRMATAYNHQRSDLPLFRFLADLQGQGLRTSLLFRAHYLIPKLPYYPRVRYRNIIVSPATWYIESHILPQNGDLSERSTWLQQYLIMRIPSLFIKTGDGDRTLFLCLDTHSDVAILLRLLEKDRQLYLEEAHLPQRPIVFDPYGKPYLPQIMLTLGHHQTVASAPEILRCNPAIEDKKWIPPGGQWLYFEIFCDPLRVNELMQVKLRLYLQQNRKCFSLWFFIRYNEGGDHIRLRMKLKDEEVGYKLTRELSAALEQELISGIVSDIRVGTYKKEVHRYSTALMDDIEQLFCRDSRYVMSLLALKLSDHAKYYLCCDLMQSVLLSNVMENQKYYNVLERMSKALNKEHEITTGGFKQINMLYRKFMHQNMPTLTKRSHLLLKGFRDKLISLLGRSDSELRQQLLADFMHMHINRLFSTHQRTHEMIIYNFCILSDKQRRYKERTVQTG